MAQKTSTFGIYQLANLFRQQAKFMMVVLTSSEELIPKHDFIRVDLATDNEAAPSKIQNVVDDRGYPLWWPIVLISEDGIGDAAVVSALEASGFVNVFAILGGWKALINESTRPLP